MLIKTTHLIKKGLHIVRPFLIVTYAVIFTRDFNGLDEALLIQACVANDRKAQFALYQKHFAFVSGICLRYLKEEGLARETTNDVFLKAFTKMNTFDINKASLLT